MPEFNVVHLSDVSFSLSDFVACSATSDATTLIDMRSRPTLKSKDNVATVQAAIKRAQIQ